MATMREKWTDERLDDLNHRVDLGFDRSTGASTRLSRAPDRIESRLDSIRRAVMVQGVIALSGAMLAGWAAMIALVATQL